MGTTFRLAANVGVMVAVSLVSACGDEGNSSGSQGVGQGGAAGNAAGGGVAYGLDPRPGETDSRESFLLAYGGAICAMFSPCCNAAGKGYNQAGCEGWVSKVEGSILKGDFDSAKARACLDQIRAVASDPARCDGLSYNDAILYAQCASAFTTPGAQPGESCTKSTDCAHSGGERSDCELGLCRRYTAGTKVGDTPCQIVKDASPPTTTIYQCEASSGVYCNREKNVCEPLVEAEGYCPFSNACVPTAMCTGGICKAKPKAGEPCLNGIKGAGGFCLGGFSCNASTLLCEPTGGEAGKPCNTGADCPSEECDHKKGTCTPYDFSKHINCTG